MNNEERPIVVAVHPTLIAELKYRRDTMQEELGRKTKGGLTLFSQLAAKELRSIREKGNEIFKEISHNRKPKVFIMNIDGFNQEVVLYEDFKKLYIYSTILNKKKD